MYPGTQPPSHLPSHDADARMVERLAPSGSGEKLYRCTVLCTCRHEQTNEQRVAVRTTYVDGRSFQDARANVRHESETQAKLQLLQHVVSEGYWPVRLPDVGWAVYDSSEPDRGWRAWP